LLKWKGDKMTIRWNVKISNWHDGMLIKYQVGVKASRWNVIISNWWSNKLAKRQVDELKSWPKEKLSWQNKNLMIPVGEKASWSNVEQTQWLGIRNETFNLSLLENECLSSNRINSNFEGKKLFNRQWRFLDEEWSV
jgi:hypothetical protein